MPTAGFATYNHCTHNKLLEQALDAFVVLFVDTEVLK